MPVVVEKVSHYSNMNVNIIGAGPTGLAIAWYLANDGHNVNVYEKKPGPGGSWYEPSGTRDLHSYRALFKESFINTRALFSEMNLDYDKYFGKLHNSDVYQLLFANLRFSDYFELIKLVLKVAFNNEYYKTITVSNCIKLSSSGSKFVNAVCYIMDGVSSNVMSSYEFVQAFNYVAFSSEQTQIESGQIMSRDIENACKRKNVQFHYNIELHSVNYDNGTCLLSDGQILQDNIILALDNQSALKIIKNNWGNVHSKLTDAMYTAINVLLYYEDSITLPHSDLYYCTHTKWNILASVLVEKNIISCVICNVAEIESIPPTELVNTIVKQLCIPNPTHHKICWGSSYINGKWQHSQSSSALSKQGDVPFYGKCPSIALCGMMSYHTTPYASIEAAIEVANRFCKRKVHKPFMITHLSMIVCVILIIFIIKYDS